MFVGKGIRGCRLDKNMTQDELAEVADLSSNYICQIENGNKQAGMAALERIAIALDVSVLHLIKKSDESNMDFRVEILVEEMSDCTDEELKIISGVVRTLKKSLRNR